MPLPDLNATCGCAAFIWCCDNNKVARPVDVRQGRWKTRTGRGGLEKKKKNVECVCCATDAHPLVKERPFWEVCVARGSQPRG